MQTLQEPNVLEQPFCASGDKNTIPSAATGSQLASLAEGFPEVTQLSVEEGGIPPERADFNGAFNIISQFNFAFQNGWLPTFNQDVSDAIGGYPEGATLWYSPSTGEYAGTVVPLRSLVPNNTYNFNTTPAYIGVYWKEVGINTRANVDLSNLSATGEGKFDAKANTALDNVTTTGKNTAVSFGKPDMTAGVTVTSGTVLTDNGWLLVDGQNISNFAATCYIDGIMVFESAYSGTGTMAHVAMFQVYKGQTITHNYLQGCVFFPLDIN